MSKNNIKIPKDYSDKEFEEPTYNNFDSIQGLLNDVKYEGQVDREESVSDEFQQAIESDVEINKKKRKGKLRKKRADEEDFEFADEKESEEEVDHNISEEEESDLSEKLTKKKRSRPSRGKKGKGKKRKGMGGINQYLDIEAESDIDEESESDVGEVSKAEQERLTQQLIDRRNQHKLPQRRRFDILDKTEEELRERYEQMDAESLPDNFEEGDDIGQQGRQPSISDPKLWLVKCKPGKEKECVEYLYHKYFFGKTEQDRIKILSVACFDSLKGYIYVEAFKEANVREAVQGISTLRENSIKIVPLTEMTQVFNFDLIQKIDLKLKQWVRMKSGLYEGDLAQVVNIEDPLNKIYVRLVPRILEESTGTKKDTLGDYSKKLKKSVRPRQKLFNPQNYSDVAMKSHPVLREQCYMWNKQSFKDGFVIKSVKAKSLITDEVGPKIEELRVFDLANMKNEGGSMDIENLISTLQETEISKKKKFAKGDKIKIIKGGLKGITGKIDSHAEGVVRVIPDIEGLTDILEFTEDFVVKEFLPGDLVRVVMGSHIGKQGLIVKVDDDTAHIFSDSTNTEFKVSCHDIVYSTFQANETEQNLYFQLGDLVKLNGLNTICYVIDVNKYSLKLIDTRCEIKKVSVNEVTKLTQIKPNGIDCRRNPITKDDTVKIINGPYKDKKGVIRNIFKNFLFLYNQDFVSTNGIFVDKTENIEIMGSELLYDNYNISSGKVNIRKVPEELRKAIGNLVRIIKGNWKGYIGILKKVSDKNVAVELTSKNKTITLDLSFIQIVDDDGQIKSRNENNISTPRSNYGVKTPSYYPQSPTGVGMMSPGWNPNSSYQMQSNSPNPYNNNYTSPGRNYK